MLLSPLTESAQSPSAPSSYYDYILLIFIAFIVIRRLFRGIRGRTYSQARVLRVPVVYSILSAILLTYIFSDLIYTLIAVLMVIPGLIVGIRFGSLSTVYEENGKIMYRRSVVILAMWMILFLLRIYTELFIPADLLVNFVIDALLILSLGMLIGEAYHLMAKYRELIESKSGNDDGNSMS